MSSQLLPVNQINALPVQTIAGVVSGTAYTVGGKTARYFSPADLGLDHQSLQSVAVGASFVWYLATPYLNLLGCTLLNVLMVKTYAANLAAGIALGAYAQTRQGALDTPGPFYITTVPAASNDLAAKVSLGPATAFLAAGANGDVQRWQITYGGYTATNTGQQGVFGTDTRLVFSENNLAATDPWNSATLTVSVWAS